MNCVQTMLFAAYIMTMPHSVFAQRLPNDRECDGLRGKVHYVEETNIINNLINDTIFQKEQYTVTLFDTLWKSNGNIKKVTPTMVIKDTSFMELVIKQIADTQYYCRTEYTPDGNLKSRVVVQNGICGHERIVTTFYNNLKVEMRSYCKETGNTTQWHYFYSNNGETAKLEQVLVTRYRGDEPGELIDKIEYTDDHEGETCIERHISPSGSITKELVYELGSLSDITCGRDTNKHYIYDNRGRITEVEVYNANWQLICTEKYDYIPTGTILTKQYQNSKSGRQPKSEIIRYDEEYDGAGNWTKQTVNGQKTRKREIKYYNY